MIKFSSGVQTVANGNPDLFVAFLDYWKHSESKNGNTKVEFDTTKSLDEKEATLNAAMRKEIIKRSGVPYAAESNISEWFNHPSVKFVTFGLVAAMVDMVLPDALFQSMGLIADIRQVGFGDSMIFTVEARDYFTVSKAGRKQRTAEVHKQFKGSVTVVPENYEISVAVSLYSVMSGQVSLATLVTKAIRSIEITMAKQFYDLFAASAVGIATTATTGLSTIGSGYTQAYLTRLAMQVEAWNGGGSKPVIVGTKLALVNVLPDADTNYRYTLDDDYVKLGYIQTAFGYDVIALPQIADLTTPFGLALSNSYLWIISPASQKLIKVVLEGPTLTFSDGPYDRANLEQSTTLAKAWGMALCTNSVMGVLNV